MDPNDGRFKTEPPTETGKEPLSERQPKPDLPDDEAESLGDFAQLTSARAPSRLSDTWLPRIWKDKPILSASSNRRRLRPIHPFHAVLLAATLPLFLGALLSDVAYGRSEQVQWNNFASWLIVGGMVFCGCALLWAAIGLFSRDRRVGQALLFFGLLFATFIIGFVDALVHAKDAWAIMP